MAEAVGWVVPPPPSIEQIRAVFKAGHVTRYASGERLYRAYDMTYPATRFNPGRGAGRFHPIHLTGKGTKEAQPVPTLYAGDGLMGALCETLFRAIPSGAAPRQVPRAKTIGWGFAVLRPTRTLKLLQLQGDGLRLLGATRSCLLETPPKSYSDTARWAAQICQASRKIDGLIWISRQHDESHSVILFGDRVKEADLEAGKTLSFDENDGYLRLITEAQRIGITVTEP